MRVINEALQMTGIPLFCKEHCGGSCRSEGKVLDGGGAVAGQTAGLNLCRTLLGAISRVAPEAGRILFLRALEASGDTAGDESPSLMEKDIRAIRNMLEVIRPVIEVGKRELKSGGRYRRCCGFATLEAAFYEYFGEGTRFEEVFQ